MLSFVYNIIFRFELMSKQKKKTTTVVICQNLGLPNQTIFQDYKCTLKINFPFFGRLYIGEEHLMFVSNMFGIVKKAAIVIETITKVTEISNDTISIVGQDSKSSKKEEYIFSGLKSNNAYKIIYALWKKETLESEVLKSHNQEELQGAEKLINESKLLDQANMEINVFNPEIVESEKQKIIEIVLPCSIEQFYNFFISDEAVYSRKKHLEFKKSTNVVCTPWKRNEEMNAEMRQLSATLKLKGVPFRSQGGMTQIWLLNKHTPEEINIKAITQMTDIPYSSHFTCEEHITVLKQTPTKSRFICSTAIVFNKGTVMKNTILTRTFADYKEDYMLWTDNVRQLLEKMRKSYDDGDRRKSRGNSANVEFQTLKIASPAQESRQNRQYQELGQQGAKIIKKVDNLNRKINILIIIVAVLLFLMVLNIFSSLAHQGKSTYSEVKFMTNSGGQN